MRTVKEIENRIEKFEELKRKTGNVDCFQPSINQLKWVLTSEDE